MVRKGYESAKTKQLIVYDQHNIIYLYDDIQKMSKFLKTKGLNEGKISFPFPHVHYYNQVNDMYEENLLRHWNWLKTPLREQDE